MRFFHLSLPRIVQVAFGISAGAAAILVVLPVADVCQRFLIISGGICDFDNGLVKLRDCHAVLHCRRCCVVVQRVKGLERPICHEFLTAQQNA